MCTLLWFEANNVKCTHWFGETAMINWSIGIGILSCTKLANDNEQKNGKKKYFKGKSKTSFKLNYWFRSVIKRRMRMCVWLFFLLFLCIARWQHDDDDDEMDDIYIWKCAKSAWFIAWLKYIFGHFSLLILLFLHLVFLISRWLVFFLSLTGRT